MLSLVYLFIRWVRLSLGFQIQVVTLRSHSQSCQRLYFGSPGLKSLNRQAPWLPILAVSWTKVFTKKKIIKFLFDTKSNEIFHKGRIKMFIPQRVKFSEGFISSLLLSWSEPDCPSIKGNSLDIYTKSILMIVANYFYFCYISDLLIGPSRNRSLHFLLFPTLSGTY